MTKADAPSSDDWKVAVVTIRLIEALGEDNFREEIGQLAHALERSGLAAHRCADRLEGRSEFSATTAPSEYTRDAVLAGIPERFTEDHRRLVDAYLARLIDAGLEEPDRLRQQAATILDAAQLLVEMVRWYERRVEGIGARDLTNDTLVAIMLDWNVKPRATAKQLAEHGYHLTEGRLKMALARHLAQPPAGNEVPSPLRVLLRARGQE